MAEKVPATPDQWFMAWCKTNVEGSTHWFWREVTATGEYDPDVLEQLMVDEYTPAANERSGAT